MVKIANLRGFVYALLVNTSSIKDFEAYATSQIKSYDQNSSNLLLTRTVDCASRSCGWVASDGIFMMKNGKAVPTAEYVPDSPFPEVHFLV